MQVAQLNIPEGMIDLGVGQPSPTLLPLALMGQAAQHRLSQSDPLLLAYGAEQGNGYFRNHLAAFLSARYQIPVPSQNLMVCAGISQALDLICSLFTRPGDTIFVEEPSYFLALRIFADHGLRAIGIPMDADGMDIDALESQLARQTPVFVYTIPTFHNPSSVTLTKARRERLVALSQTHGFKIVADEVYHLLDFGGQPPLPLAAYSESGTVLALGSFSKILAPGLRLGWIQADPTLLAPFVQSGLLESGGGLNPFTSAVVSSAIELGLQDSHLDQLKTTYRQRNEALITALNRYLPGEVHYETPGGGFFVWLQLPPNLEAKRLLTVAKGNQVGFQPGAAFSSLAGLGRYIRLSFAYYEPEDLVQGVVRLADSLNDFFETA